MTRKNDAAALTALLRDQVRADRERGEAAVMAKLRAKYPDLAAKADAKATDAAMTKDESNAR